MARYGSERIRGHGIPEAIEAILINGTRVEAKVAILKPISSAISIGSGGPFGAEGPIIMTGGAFGSLIAQLFHLTSAERKTLLVAGAAGGMSATFASPVAAVLLAVELLLFEWKPRSLIPVALASAVAAWQAQWPQCCADTFSVLAHFFRYRNIRCSSGRRLCWAARWSVCWREFYRHCSRFLFTLPKTLFRKFRFTGCGGQQLAAWRLDWAAWYFRKLWESATTRLAICCRAT